jgi:hypothetical protein
LRGWGQGGEMTQALYAHINNKTIKKKENALTWFRKFKELIPVFQAITIKYILNNNCIHTIAYCLTIKRNDVMCYMEEPWKHMLSERGQSQNHISYDLIHMKCLE